MGVQARMRLRGKPSRGIRPSLALQAGPTPSRFQAMPTLSSTDPVLETQVFWDRHKKEVFAVLLIAVFAVVGWGAYRLYSERRDDSAAYLLTSAKTAADYQKVIAQYPGTPAGGAAYLFLAEEQRKEKKFSEANATLQSFLDKNPKHQLKGTARMAMASNLESLGKPVEALAAYQRLAADDPQGFTAPIALITAVRLLKEKNQNEEAQRVCETILTKYRESLVAGEATRQLKLLKPPVETIPAPTPAVNVPPLLLRPSEPPAAAPPAAVPPAGNTPATTARPK
jgi:predicted negative regulator of RcsB-dependent stress response